MERHNPILSIQDLPEMEDLTYEKLAKVYKNVRIIELIILFSIIIAGIFLIRYFFPKWEIFQYPLWIRLICLVFFVFRLTSIFVQFSYTGYALRSKDIIYRTGWFTRKIKSFPISRIQHASVQSNFIERAFGLSSISIFTAGSSSDELVIRGIEKETAEKINQWIAKKIEENDQ